MSIDAVAVLTVAVVLLACAGVAAWVWAAAGGEREI